MENSAINYRQIFIDILDSRFPEKKQNFLPLLQKQNLSVIDILNIHKKIFGISKETESSNQRHRSYNKSDILQILDYQQKHKLNNSQLAKHFKISRNTIAKWRKMFLT